MPDATHEPVEQSYASKVASEPALADQHAGRKSNIRWLILGLIFFATTMNFMDRMVMGILAPELQEKYHISNQQYGVIQGTFAFTYAFGQLMSGGLLDRFGIRVGYTVALIGWSIASMLHAVARGAWGFGIMRGFLGVAESPNFPAAAKTIAEWFPLRERAFAFGFVNAGTNMGAILAPMIVPWLATAYGWQWAFIGTGGVGLIWIVFWLPLYRKPHEHKWVSPAELAYINSDPPEPTTKVPWIRLLGFPQAWAFALGKFLTDSMWWFYITWLPKFLFDRHHMNIQKIGIPLVIIYLMADGGSIAGGYMSSFLIKRGVSVNVARKSTMLLCAFGVMPIMLAQWVSGMWTAVLILGLATASHQGFSTNLYTLVSDMFPKRAVASVAGFGGMFGYFGAFLFQIFVGYMVTAAPAAPATAAGVASAPATTVAAQPNYLVPFICASVAYLVAIGVIQLLAPRMKPAIVEAPAVA